jgi:hypothetical protein
MGAGRLFVLVRRGPNTWALERAAIDQPEAQQVVNDLLASVPGVRVVVAGGLRSFVADVVVTEDPAVVVDPNVVQSGAAAGPARRVLPRGHAGALRARES